MSEINQKSSHHTPDKDKDKDKEAIQRNIISSNR